MELSQLIDHTLLKPESRQEQIDKIIQEADRYGFASVCVNPVWVSYASEKLANSPVKVCTVIGFPLGANTSETKAFEARNAIANGADEIDMVINIGAAKDGKFDIVQSDIAAVVEASGDTLVKVIIETCLLTEDEKIKACQAAVAAGADFVKTSTGFSTGGATVEDIALMRQTVGSTVGVKASGGARTLQDALDFIGAGATRIGASSGVAIVEGESASEDY